MYAPVIQHAFVCHECGHGQLGDRGVQEPRTAYPSNAAWAAAQRAAFDAGRGWDGRTFVMAPLGADNVDCPHADKHGGALPLSEADQLRAELAELKAQFTALATGKPVDAGAAMTTKPDTIANLVTQLKALNAPVAG